MRRLGMQTAFYELEIKWIKIFQLPCPGA